MRTHLTETPISPRDRSQWLAEFEEHLARYREHAATEKGEPAEEAP